MNKAAGLEYEEHGRGDPVLLIHGAFISDALSLMAREPALTEGNRVIWYRRRGYGGSDPLSPTFSIAEQAGEALTLLTELGVDRAHLVGHSGGGVIATEIALQAPERVRSLVVLEPAIFPPAIAAAFPDMLKPAREAFESGDAAAGVDEFMAVVAPKPDWRGELRPALPDGPERADADAPTTFVELDGFAGFVFDADRASRLSPPVLYVWGSESGPMIEAFKDYFVSLVPKAETAVLPGVDHSLPTQDPARVAETVTGFLARQP